MMMDYWPVYTTFGAIVLINQCYKYLTRPGLQVHNQHVIITGGSIGLGFSIAKKYVLRGAKVTIVARNMDKLKAAQTELESLTPGAKSVFIYSADVSNDEAMKKAVSDSIVFHGQEVYQIIACAGLSLPGYFLDQSLDIFHKEMDVNYFGTLNLIKAALPSMIEHRGTGRRVVIISSACGYIGFIGFSQYCASKYALRGLADSLRNELKLYEIDVSIYYPGSIDTPGFEIEQRTKPVETQTIEGTTELVSADSAADSLVDGLVNGEYAITNDLGVWFLRVIGNGMAPRGNTIVETMLLPIIGVIQFGYLCFIDFIVTQSRRRQEKGQKETKKKE